MHGLMFVQVLSGMAMMTTAEFYNVENVTLPDPCFPFEKRECDGQGGAIAGAALGSLLAGAIIGAAATFFALKYMGKREVIVPPKDYKMPGTATFDVNRNNGETTWPPEEEIIPPQPQEIKGHKKLQRLVQPVQNAPDVEIPSSATPLIDTPGDMGRDGDPESLSGTEMNSDAPNDALYLNLGHQGLFSQPYDSLEIIPEEEVEYENSPNKAYEQLNYNMPLPKKPL